MYVYDLYIQLTVYFDSYFYSHEKDNINCWNNSAGTIIMNMNIIIEC